MTTERRDLCGRCRSETQGFLQVPWQNQSPALSLAGRNVAPYEGGSSDPSYLQIVRVIGGVLRLFCR